MNDFIFPIHVTNRSQNRERFQIPTDEAWDVACMWLRFVIHSYNIDLHLFLMMDNHIHMIASAPENNLSQALRYFFSETSRTMNQLSSRINHTWGKQHRQTKIKNYGHFLNAYKYGYYNPVAAKMVERVEDYPYSTLRGLIGLDQCVLPVKDDLLFSNGLKRHLEWLNFRPSIENWTAVQRALRRKQFTLPRINARPHPLELGWL